MLSDDLQRRIAAGEREAFATLYQEYGRAIYLFAMSALDDADKAKRVVKESFLALHAAIRAANAPVDADAVLEEATDRAIAKLKDAGAPSLAAPVVQEEDADDLDSYAAPEETPLPPKKRSAKRETKADEAEVLLARVRARAPEVPEAPKGQPDEIPVPKNSALGNVILSLFLVVFLVLFLWILAGILMDFELLPRIDLGYRWFNDTFFQLFSL